MNEKLKESNDSFQEKENILKNENQVRIKRFIIFFKSIFLCLYNILSNIWPKFRLLKNQ